MLKLSCGLAIALLIACASFGPIEESVKAQKQNGAPRPRLMWQYTVPGGFYLKHPVRVAVDSLDNSYVVTTNSSSASDTPIEVQVVKVSPLGSQIYLTKFTTVPGSGQDIAVDSSGFAYILWNNLVSKIDPAGTGLVYHGLSTGLIKSVAIAVDASSNLYIAGQLNNPKGVGPNVAAVAKLDSTGNLLWTRLIGSSGGDAAFAIALDTTGNVWVTGATTSVDFPTLNPLQASLAGSTDAFIAKLDMNGNELFASYLGGAGFDQGLAIVSDRIGNIHLAGETNSTNFFVLKPGQRTLKGSSDGFSTVVGPNGSLVSSTYLGGSNFDQIEAIGVDSQRATYVTGFTQSLDFPLLRSQQTTLLGNWQSFLTSITQAGSNFNYSTYQEQGDLNTFYEGLGLAIDSQDNVLLAIDSHGYAGGGDHGVLLKFTNK